MINILLFVEGYFIIKHFYRLLINQVYFKDK